MINSIRTKLILLILIALILPAIILGGTSIIFTQRLTDEYASENISLICEENASKINIVFAPLEQSVDYMSINAIEDVSNIMNLTDEIYYDNYIEKMKSILWNTGNNTDGAIAIYLRLNPDLCGATSGLFMTRNSIDSEMVAVTPTDLKAYDEDDIEHVGWYYQPIKTGEPIWMAPYYNKNIDIYMISYVVPMFKDGDTLGVLGMDVNFNFITEQVENIKVYDSGYAYITGSDGSIIYHPSLSYGDTFTPLENWITVSSSLENGMILNITVPENEVNKLRNNLITNLVLITVLLVIAFILVTVYLTNKMISPLQKLNSIANEIADGNYNVDFNFARPKDEIGQLTNSFEHTVSTLKEYTSYINGLAYKDALTEVRNRTAYENQIAILEKDLKDGKDISFTIAVFDVNNLKKVNDNLGHEKGDILIKGACQLICKVFSHSAVFRIGGDEFAAIIRDAEDEKIKELFDSFYKEMEATWNNEEIEYRVSVAYGYSKYDSANDNGEVEASFKRADDMMYENKKAMKATR